MNNYYMQQSGSGIGGFAGIRYQKGHGFFGRLVSGTILPILKKMLPFLGKTALSTGMDVVRDVSQGEKIGSSVKRRLRETAESLSDKAMAKVREMTGSGAKRRRRRKRVTANRVIKQKTKRTTTKRKRASKRKGKRSSTKRRTRKAVDFL